MFEIKNRSGLARIGEFTTPHGTVETPAIMPVLNPNLELIPTKKLQNEFHFQILITNSYIIYRDEELKKKALKKGVHDLLDFSGPIMTDSGTFQAHVYGDIDVDPEEIVRFQKEIGSDVSTILDEFTEPDDPWKEVKRKVRKTVERARKAREMFGDLEGHIAYPIQGSIYPELRKECGEELKGLEGNFYPIGGVVPLLEEYRFKELVEAVISSKEGLGPRGPIHLFGAGHPMIYALAVSLGCDLFDSSSYAKYAKRGDMMFPDGTKKLKDISYLGCECPVCTKRTAEELKDLDEKEKEIRLAEHNLWISQKEIKKVKQAILDGSLWELVERRARGHPKLLNVFSVLEKKSDFLERYEPRSRKRALFYIGPETYLRPAIERLQRWIMDTYEPPVKGPTVLFDIDEDKKPYHRYIEDRLHLLDNYEVNLLVNTPIGPVPLEMDEIYPVAQSIFPDDLVQEDGLEEYKKRKDIADMVKWEGKKTLEVLPKNKSEALSYGERKVKTTSNYQFGRDVGKILTNGELTFVKNNKGRIKNVFLDDEHILSIRHYDGFFTLKKAGAELLWRHTSSPKLRMKVTEESAEFNRNGKSVFAKFVTAMDKKLRPGDESIVVTGDDDLVAAARVFLTSREVQAFDRGLAAKTRCGFEKKAST